MTDAQILHHGRRIRVRAKRFVVACGAINTAALLLRSASSTHPGGLANSSDQVGRNYMTHVTTFFLAIDPRRKNEAVYQKTIGINDWYTAGPTNRYPLGNIQGLGKLRGPQAKLGKPWVPLPILDEVTKYTLDLFIQSEDLPLPENRVTLNSNGQITLARRETNLATHHELIRRMKKLLHAAGFPITLTRSLGNRGDVAPMRNCAHGRRPRHQCGRHRPACPRSGEPVDRRQLDLSVVGRGQSGDHRRRAVTAAGPVRRADRLGGCT